MKPDVAQRAEKDREISSTGGREQAGDVLNDDPSARSNKLIGDPCELKEESRPLAGESRSLACDGEVLTREPATEKVKAGGGALTPVATLSPSITPSRGVPNCSSPHPHTSYVVVAGDIGPVLGEDSPAPLVPLALEHDAHSGSLESEIEAANAREEAADIHAASLKATHVQSRFFWLHRRQ